MKTQLGTVELEGYLLNVEFKEISDKEIECKSLENKRGHVKGNIFYTSPKSLVNIFKEKSDREQAIEWWLNIDHTLGRVNLQERYFGTGSLVRNLSDEEIEQIWRKETHFKGFFEIKKKDRVQVDFEMLRDSIDDTLNLMSESMVSDGYIHNLKLFFELLSKSSTFAHKAHKELNRLMK